MMSIFRNIISKIGGVAGLVLDAVGLVAGIVAHSVPMPAWAKMTLKVISVAAPAAAAVIAVTECVKDFKDCQEPKSITEKTLENKNSKSDADDDSLDINEDYKNAVSEAAAELNGKSHNGTRNKSFREINPAVEKCKNRKGTNDYVKSRREKIENQYTGLDTCDEIARSIPRGGYFYRTSAC